jgi:hypothetical protein
MRRREFLIWVGIATADFVAIAEPAAGQSSIPYRVAGSIRLECAPVRCERTVALAELQRRLSAAGWANSVAGRTVRAQKSFIQTRPNARMLDYVAKVRLDVTLVIDGDRSQPTRETFLYFDTPSKIVAIVTPSWEVRPLFAPLLKAQPQLSIAELQAVPALLSQNLPGADFRHLSIGAIQ